MSQKIIALMLHWVAMAGLLAGAEVGAQEPAPVTSAVPCDVPSKPAAELFRQPFSDVRAIAQHFAEQLGRFRERNQTTSPEALAEQARAENGFAVKTRPERGVKLKSEAVYAAARRGVVVVGGIFKCPKCHRWHAKCACGFVVREDGLVVTNLHVLDAYRKLEAIGIMTDDGRVFPAKAVLGASRLNDLALLKVDASGLQALAVCADVPVGATVYCLSHPAVSGSNGFYAFSQGTVCGKFAVQTGKQEPVKVLAVTTEYGPGSSGGPILNEQGAVVGIVCQTQPVFKSEQEKTLQMIWKLARPSCSILEMLSATTSREPAGDRSAPAKVQPGAKKAPPVPPAAVRSPPGGEVSFNLQPRDAVSIRYYRPMRVTLVEEPTWVSAEKQRSRVERPEDLKGRKDSAIGSKKPKAEPKYRAEKPRYGELRLGDAADNRFLVVLDEPEDGEPRIFIDRNGDLDLTNDGDGQWTQSSESVLSLNNVVIDVPYATGKKIPYRFNFYRFKGRSRDSLLYYRGSGREGEIVSDGKHYKVLVLDENADGRFDDLANGTLILDLNRDGKLESDSDSAEHYKLNAPFNIHGQVWEVASVSPDGLVITLRPSRAEVAMKAYLDPGYPAPLFVGKDLAEKTIDLKAEAGRAKYVLLDFWASWCGPCRGEFPYVRRVHAQYKEHGLKIIGVNLDSERESAVQAAEKAGLNYPHVFDGQGWKNAVSVLYRVHGIPQTYLLDKDLKIVAKNLRGEGLERRLGELLGPGDKAAAEAVEKKFEKKDGEAPIRPPSKPVQPKFTRKPVTPEQQKELDEASELNGQVYRLWKEGKFREALPVAEKALAMRQRILGNDDPATSQSLFNLGAQHFGLKDYARAEPLWQQAYDINRRLLGPEDSRTKSYASSLARLRAAVKEEKSEAKGDKSEEPPPLAKKPT